MASRTIAMAIILGRVRPTGSALSSCWVLMAPRSFAETGRPNSADGRARAARSLSARGFFSIDRGTAMIVGSKTMHVANLQLEGLLMAVASINNVLVRKGVVSIAEIDEALAKAESGLMADEHVAGDMSASNRDAVCFPIRFLRLANLGQSEDAVQSFAELAREVGRLK